MNIEEQEPLLKSLENQNASSTSLNSLGNLVGPNLKTLSGNSKFYKDYSAIDWLQDLVLDAERTREIIDQKQSGGFKGKFFAYYDSIIGWLLCFIIGLTIAILGAGIDVISDLLSDFKTGFCLKNWILSKNRCDLKDWKSWDDYFNLPSTGLFYVIIGLIFALISGLIVTISANLMKTTINIPNNNNVNNINNNNNNRISNLSNISNESINILPKKRLYYSAGSGLPEVKIILSGFIIKKFLGFTVLVTKSLGLIFSIASGLTIGKQGPLVHISCCIGNILSRIFPKYAFNEGKKREILSASTAAGVSVAFGSTLGGVLFSLEEISYYFPLKTLWRTFFCSIITTFTLKILNPFGNGKLVSFQMIKTSHYTDWQMIELIPFIIIGIIGGLLGSLFIKLNLKWSNYRKKFVNNPLMEIFFISLLTGILNYQFEFTSLSSTDLVSLLFTNCQYLENLPNYQKSTMNTLCNNNLENFIIKQLIITCLIKFILALLTFACKVPGGIFMPSITIGASFGRLIGLLMLKLNFSVDPSLYAMVGAAAMVSGVTRMTITLAVIMFELTGLISNLLPIMITIMISKWVSDFITQSGIYEEIIKENNYPYLGSHIKRYKKKFIPLDRVIIKPFLILYNNHEYNLIELFNLLKNFNEDQEEIQDIIIPLLNTNFENNLIGTINYQDLYKELLNYSISNNLNININFNLSSELISNELNLYHLINKSPLMIYTNTSFDLVLELFRKLGLNSLNVINLQGQFQGIIYKKSLLWNLNNNQNVDTRSI